MSGETVPILREVWRSLEVGGILIRDQRFIVVRNIMTSVILGSDYWGRVSPMTFDFEKNMILLGPDKVEVPLSDGESGSKGTKECQLTFRRTQIIPPMTDVLIEGKAKGVQSLTTYLLEPKLGEDSRMQSPYSVVKAKNMTQST